MVKVRAGTGEKTLADTMRDQDTIIHPNLQGNRKQGIGVAKMNDFDGSDLSKHGFLLGDVTAEYFFLIDKQTQNEIIVWRLGDWLQFRCMVYDLHEGVGSKKYLALSETINRMHDVALGARVSLNDKGEVVLVADVLHSTVSTGVVATIAMQLLFLSERLLEYLEKMEHGQGSLTIEQINEMLSQPASAPHPITR